MTINIPDYYVYKLPNKGGFSVGKKVKQKGTVMTVFDYTSKLYEEVNIANMLYLTNSFAEASTIKNMLCTHFLAAQQATKELNNLLTQLKSGTYNV